MKNNLKSSLLAAIVAVVVAGSSPLMFAQAEAFAGMWEGKRDGVPAVILKIAESGGAPQGQATFYLLKKIDGEAPTIDGKMEVAMTDMRVQGNTLDFRVAREDRSVNPPDKTMLSFTMELTGNGFAKLIRAGGGDGSEVEMVRQK